MVVAIFFIIFYTVAINSHPSIKTPLPTVNMNTSSNTIKIPDGFTFKLIHKNGWHPCVEDPGVFCNGPYTINQTIQKYQTLRPPPFPSPPPPPSFPSALNMTTKPQPPQILPNPSPPPIGNLTTPLPPPFKSHGNNITELLHSRIQPQGCPDDTGVLCSNERIIK